MRCNLSVRVAVAVMLIAVLFSTVTSYFLYQRIHASTIAEARISLRQLGQTVQRTASIAAYLDNSEIGWDAVNGLAQNDMVGAVHLKSATGLELNYGKEQSVDKSHQVTLELIAPFDVNEWVGTLQIMPKQGLLEKIARKEASERSFLLFSYTLVIALLVLLCMQFLFVRALKMMASELATIEPGSSEQLHMPVAHHKDEIGSLVININNLLNLVKRKLDSERSLRLEVESLEKQFRMIFESASVGIFLVDTQHRLIMANSSFWNLIGKRATTECHSHGGFLEEIFVEHVQVGHIINETLQHGLTKNFEMELKTNRDEPKRRWAHCLFNVVKSDDQQAYVQGILDDISNLKEKEEQLRHQAGHDPLTGLMNRRASADAITAMFAKAEESHLSVYLFLIDLDDFKPINDTYGHDAGDAVLVEIAERLKRFKRHGDILSRLGGDEFLFAIAAAIENKQLEQIAARLLKTLVEPITLDAGVNVQIGASIGIASSADHGDEMKTLLSMADNALYRVKESGKNDFEIG